MTEFFCPYCKEWADASQCQPHFVLAHRQDEVTLEKLDERLAHLGGVGVRETETTVVEEGKSFWGWMGGAR